MTEPGDEIENTEFEEEIPLSSQYLAAMMNKYEESSEDNTIANRIADMIVQYETDNGIQDEYSECEWDEEFTKSVDEDEGIEITAKKRNLKW